MPQSVSSAFRHLRDHLVDVGLLAHRNRFHDLRRFHGSELLDVNVPLSPVKERLGHSSEVLF
jgi:integrase